MANPMKIRATNKDGITEIKILMNHEKLGSVTSFEELTAVKRVTVTHSKIRPSSVTATVW